MLRIAENPHLKRRCLPPGAQGNEATVVRYIMPDGGGYDLQQDAVYTLPIQGGGKIDIAPSTSLLWMTDNNKVQLVLNSSFGVCRMRCHRLPT